MKTWTIILRCLHGCIGDILNCVIILYPYPLIIALVEPNVHHEYFNHYIKCNMCAYYKKMQTIEGLFQRATKTYCVSNFNATMRIIYQVNPNTTTYLVGIGYNKWTQAHFDVLQYNNMTTNIVESFNALILIACGLPITIFVEFIHSTL